MPGFEKQRGRYLLSLTNAAEAVGKDEISIRRFLDSAVFKSLLGKASEFDTFSVEGAQKPIVGIPHEIADEYWYDQSVKGNKRARSPQLHKSSLTAFKNYYHSQAIITFVAPSMR